MLKWPSRHSTCIASSMIDLTPKVKVKLIFYFVYELIRSRLYKCIEPDMKRYLKKCKSLSSLKGFTHTPHVAASISDEHHGPQASCLYLNIIRYLDNQERISYLVLVVVSYHDGFYLRECLFCVLCQAVSLSNGRTEVHTISQQFSALMPEEVDQFAQFLQKLV